MFDKYENILVTALKPLNVLSQRLIKAMSELPDK